MALKAHARHILAPPARIGIKYILIQGGEDLEDASVAGHCSVLPVHCIRNNTQLGTSCNNTKNAP